MGGLRDEVRSQSKAIEEQAQALRLFERARKADKEAMQRLQSKQAKVELELSRAVATVRGLNSETKAIINVPMPDDIKRLLNDTDSDTISSTATRSTIETLR